MISNVIQILLQGFTLFLFILISVYTLFFSKKGTGIKPDYFITSILLLLLMWRIS